MDPQSPPPFLDLPMASKARKQNLSCEKCSKILKTYHSLQSDHIYTSKYAGNMFPKNNVVTR